MRKVYVGLLAAGISALPHAPSASALPPGCNWNTDAGVAACMGTGAGSFDASATGGDTGDIGFASAVQSHVPETQNWDPRDVIQLGMNICRQIQLGMSEATAKAGVAKELAQKGYPTQSAPYLVDTARQYICPPRPR
ncbi:DUF732 domain-containing protein [Mycolicibacterium llatzerense]|uniref:DUF732 domain-containing protein n=1 Tax=Mycolicibacterium llatzerense TaxID=280871 RepID=UPI0009F48085|nr:DUF732 domain-containing protein [Mycolicibacterium llatzerense]